MSHGHESRGTGQWFGWTREEWDYEAPGAHSRYTVCLIVFWRGFGTYTAADAGVSPAPVRLCIIILMVLNSVIFWVLLHLCCHSNVDWGFVLVASLAQVAHAWRSLEKISTSVSGPTISDKAYKVKGLALDARLGKISFKKTPQRPWHISAAILLEFVEGRFKRP